jgi:hypothetical protein
VIWGNQIVALVDVHGGHDGQILNLVGVWANRIGTEHWMSPQYLP